MLRLFNKATDGRRAVKETVMAMTMEMDKRTFAHPATFRIDERILQCLDSNKFGAGNNYGSANFAIPIDVPRYEIGIEKRTPIGSALSPRRGFVISMNTAGGSPPFIEPRTQIAPMPDVSLRYCVRVKYARRDWPGKAKHRGCRPLDPWSLLCRFPPVIFF